MPRFLPLLGSMYGTRSIDSWDTQSLEPLKTRCDTFYLGYPREHRFLIWVAGGVSCFSRCAGMVGRGPTAGVDISKEAITDARKISDQRSAWAVSAFESFCSPFRWDAIAMVESIYYIKVIDLPLFLSHAMEMLNEQGIFLFRLHDLDKHRQYVETVQRLYPHTQKVDLNLFSVILLRSNRRQTQKFVDYFQG
jgi:hypothetical protein